MTEADKALVSMDNVQREQEAIKNKHALNTKYNTTGYNTEHDFH